MTDFLNLMAVCLDFLKIEIVIYEFSFTIWEVFMFGLIMSAVIFFVRGVIIE